MTYYFPYSETYLLEKFKRAFRAVVAWGIGLSTFILAAVMFAAMLAWIITLFVGA